MLEHFCHGDAMILCSLDKKETKELIQNFDHVSLENVRQLKSFRKLVENSSYENQIKLLTNDDYFRTVLNEEIVKLQKYIRRLHIFLECLLILVADLPKAPLGKQVRLNLSLTNNSMCTFGLMLLKSAYLTNCNYYYPL